MSETDAFEYGSFFEHDIKKYYDYSKVVSDLDETVDYEDLQQVNREMNLVVTALYRITEKINTAERRYAVLQQKYDTKYRSFYINAQGKNESIRKALAEIECEDDYIQVAVYKQVVKELERSSQTLRNHLQVLQGISNNLRQQMKV